MSKGSTRRPSQITDKQADDNWNRIFGKGKPLEEHPLQHNALFKKLYHNHLLKDDIDGFTEENNHVRQETKRHRKETNAR